MKNLAKFCLIGVCILFVSGCLSSGLSVRENRNFNYSNYIYSLYDQKLPKTEAPKKLSFPLKLAVVQIGEYAPPESLLQDIKENSSLFAQVEAIPGVFDLESSRRYNSHFKGKTEEDQNLPDMEKMLRFAKDLGMEYLFVYGGSIDSTGRSTFISLLDWTIVGAYIIPSYSIKAEAKGAGALIDLTTSGIILVVNAESNLETLIPTAQTEGSQERFMQRIRDEVVKKLTENLIQKIQEKHV